MSRDKDNTLIIMKNECLWGVDIEFKMFMQKVKSVLKQTTPLQICTAPFIHRRSEISDTKTTSGCIPYEALYMWYCVYCIHTETMVAFLF